MAEVVAGGTEQLGSAYVGGSESAAAAAAVLWASVTTSVATVVVGPRAVEAPAPGGLSVFGVDGNAVTGT